MKASTKRPSSRSTRRVRPSPSKRRPARDGFSFFRACAIAFALGLFGVIGLDALMSEEFSPAQPAAAATAPLRMAWSIDTDGDGLADIANPVEGVTRGQDRYGSGAFGSARDGGKRKHEGVDYAAPPGHKATAPIAGVVVRIGHAYKNDARLAYIEIANKDNGYSAKVLYVAPSVTVGQRLAAGETIGVVQDLSVKYPAGITNHVHVEVRDPTGAPLDASMILPAEPIVQAATQSPPQSRDPA